MPYNVLLNKVQKRIDVKMPPKKKIRNKHNSDHNPEHGEVIIRGLVMPSGWDEKGNVTDIAVSAFDEKVYHIIKDEKGDQLIPFIRKEVEITGLAGYEGGVNKIKVDRYIHKKD